MTGPRAYWAASRAPRYSLLFALPLALAYEGLVIALPEAGRTGIRNGADVLFQQAFTLIAGRAGPMLFWGALILVAVGLVARDWRRHPGPLSGWTFATMLVEALALAVVCGAVVTLATRRLLAGLTLAAQAGAITGLSGPTKLMLSLGAGLYEELLFRVVMVTALAWFARRMLTWSPPVSGAFAVLVGALCFSTFHYIGPYGEPLELFSFTYRMLAGVFFSTLYLLRGFGITAWTHALYDVLVLLVA